MDYSKYEIYGFDQVSAFNLSTGYKERSYPMHWHSYGEIILVGPGKTNVFMVNQNTYQLVEGDFLLVWPMEMHARRMTCHRAQWRRWPESARSIFQEFSGALPEQITASG